MLDTWFSSQLWPFSVFGWPENTADVEAFYPGHAMVTAPEILFFWVSRMIMMGYEFFGEPPFREVYLHGTVRDMKGRKMSKSLGNGIDPLEVVNAHGADAMRYTLVSQAAVGTDISLDHEDVEGAFANGRNFANKIWNAGRFALLSLGDAPVRPLAEVAGDLALEDRWILSRLRNSSENATRGLERYRLHDVAESLYHFFWGEVCDWYLELVKERLTEGADAAGREAARSTLVTVLDHSYRLLHPIVPFVTAELWSRLPWPEGDERPEDLIVAPWPDGSDGPSGRGRGTGLRGAARANCRGSTAAKAIWGRRGRAHPDSPHGRRSQAVAYGPVAGCSASSVWRASAAWTKARARASVRMRCSEGAPNCSCRWKASSTSIASVPGCVRRSSDC